ncbi:hypothetical protein HNR33_003217 [Brassicibacter mesophilus]
MNTKMNSFEKYIDLGDNITLVYQEPDLYLY